MILSGKQATKSTRSDDPYFVKDYFQRYHLRTLKHFPQLHTDQFLQSVPINHDDDDFYSDLNGLKSSRATQFRQMERENDCFSYKRSKKLMKASKKFRRKQSYDVENDEIAYLNRLAETVLTNDSIVHRLAGVSEVNKKMSNLLDRIHQEISKAKRN